jgi:hypothetical protein
MEAILSGILGIEITIENPFLYRTKAEVVEVVRTALPAGIVASVSCWRTPRGRGQAAHCGVCIPCFVRRVALEFGGADPTVYEKDPWRVPLQDQPAEDTGRRNLVDLGIFVQKVKAASDEEMMHHWPELIALAGDEGAAIAMYRRFVEEVRAVLSRYPLIAAVLQ